MCWSRVKANKAAVTAQHSKLSARLEELQQQQQQQQQQFKAQAEQLLLLQVGQYAQQMLLASRQQQQQQQAQQVLQGMPSAFPASVQPSVPSSLQPPLSQQQQQQQWQQLPQQQQQQHPGNLQLQQLEEEIHDVERLLFSDLEAYEATATPTSAGSLPAWSQEGPLNGLLQEQLMVQPEACVLPDMSLQQQQQQELLQGTMPQQQHLLLQEQQQQQQQLPQMCVLPPAQLPPLQLQFPPQQQPAVLQSQQCSQMQVKSEVGCASTSTYTAVSCQQQPQQQSAAGSAVIAGPPENASQVPLPLDSSFSGILLDPAAAGMRGSSSNSAAQPQSQIEEVLLPVGVMCSAAGVHTCNWCGVRRLDACLSKV
jgi:hypothetical protein